jgi:nitrogen fixation-related uncharacterized protein
VPFIVYLIIGLIIGGLFFGLAIMGLNWAVKNGQFRDLDKGSRVVFDDEEPKASRPTSSPGGDGKWKRRLIPKAEGQILDDKTRTPDHQA